MNRTILSLLSVMTISIILASIILAPIPSIAEESNWDSKRSNCTLILTPSNWLLLGLKGENTSQLTITVVSKGTALKITIPRINESWSRLEGSFIDKTLAYSVNSNITMIRNGFRVQGYLQDVLRNIASSAKILSTKTITVNLTLEPNSTRKITLFKGYRELISNRSGIGLIVELWVNSFNGSINSITTRVYSGNTSFMQSTPLTSNYTILNIPLTPLLTIGYSNVTRIDLDLKASSNGFKGVVTIAFYILEYSSPIANVKLTNKTYSCRTFIDMAPPLHLIALNNAVKAYTSKLVRDIPVPSPNINVGDYLEFTHTYKAKIKAINEKALEEYNMSKLVSGIKSIFGSTNISFSWNTSLLFKLVEVRLREVDYAIKVHYLYVNYTPQPIYGGVPICGDGVIGLCLVSYLNRLSGGRVAVQLLQPGLSYTGKAQWNTFPWGVDPGASGYTPKLQDIVYNPITITQVYLGYPFSSLSPTLIAYWFHGIGRVVNYDIGVAGPIPVVYVKFEGEDYEGELAVDTYYLIPLKAYFNGTSSPWRTIGVEYNTSYSLRLTSYKGFWRNIKAYAIPVNITLRNNYTYKGYIILSQPELENTSAVYNGRGVIWLKVKPHQPVRILLLGNASLIRGLGELFTLSLIGTVKVLAPARLLLVPSSYGELLVFHTYYPVNSSVGIVLLSGKYWDIDRVEIGKPIPLNTRELSLNLGIEKTSTHTASKTSTIEEGVEATRPSIERTLIIGITSIALIAIALLVHFMRTKLRKTKS